MSEDAAKSQSNRAAVVLSIVAALVGGWLLHGWVFLHGQTDPWASGSLIGVGIAVGVVLFKWQNWRQARAIRAEEHRARQRGEHGTIWSDDARFRPERSWVAPVAILAAFATYGFVDASRARDNYVRPYCLYGAQSHAQLDGCMSHVTSDDINDLDTPAAQFGRGETSDCLEDSGPYCADASKWNSLEPSD
jgi:hypothetical protein